MGDISTYIVALHRLDRTRNNNNNENNNDNNNNNNGLLTVYLPSGPSPVNKLQYIKKEKL